DWTGSKCGSGEARNGAARYFLVLCSPNPASYDSSSWAHEGWHLALGHSALRYTLLGIIDVLPAPFNYAKEALNTFLDIGYVGPAEAFGKHGVILVQVGVAVIVLVGLLFSRRRHR